MYLLACARRAWDRLPGVCRALVALGEVYADSPAEYEWLRARLAPVAEQLMHSAGEDSALVEARVELVAARLFTPDVDDALRAADDPPDPPHASGEWQELARLVYLPFVKSTPAYKWVPRARHSCDLLREVFGNPCRFAPFPHAWRTDTAVALAKQMYGSRDFGAMPILADALQDAGCDDATVLDHCRGEPAAGGAGHVRGCWVLDRVLNRR